jgi:dihydroorotase
VGFDLVVKGGLLALPGGSRVGDLGISGGRIEAVGDLAAAGQVVDAGGLIVLPGMIDSHVHLMDPGPVEREDFPTGTGAASARGVTTIVEHTHAWPVRSPEQLREKVRHLEGRSNVDYALAAHLWPEDIGGMARLWRAGVTFFKIFTCNTHGVPAVEGADLLEALRTIASFDGIALVHCEDEDLTRLAEASLKSEGRADPGLLVEWRSREAELAAIAGLTVLARLSGARVTVAHVSTPLGAGIISEARHRGADVAAEACPQYFALDEQEVEEHAALRKFTPPARIRSEDERDSMWDALRSGAFSHISTDHAPSTLTQKAEGDIWSAPFGLPGLDTTLPFLVDAALSGRIGLEMVADLYSRAPALRYGLTGKGSLEPRSDADFVLVDPEGRWAVRDEDILSKAGWSPYSGRVFRGSVVATYLRGVEISRAGQPGDARTGRFIPGPGAAAGGDPLRTMPHDR